MLEIWERTGDAIANGAAAARGRAAKDYEGMAFVATSLHQAAAIRFSIDGDRERLDRNLSTLERAVRALLREEMQ